MTATVVHQSYMTQCHALFTLISYFAIAFSFIVTFTDNWFPCCAMALGLLFFISWVIWNNTSINPSFKSYNIQQYRKSCTRICNFTLAKIV